MYSENFNPYNLNIDIKDNNFSNNSTGFFAARMAVNKFKLEQTKMNNNQIGWIIKKLHQLRNKPNFKINKDEFSHNKGLGIQIEDACFKITECEIWHNGQTGIAVSGTNKPSDLLPNIEEFLIKHPMEFLIESSIINLNLSSGMSFINYWKGPISIKKWEIQSNSKFGIELCMKQNTIKTAETLLPTNNDLDRMHSGGSTFRMSTRDKLSINKDEMKDERNNLKLINSLGECTIENSRLTMNGISMDNVYLKVIKTPIIGKLLRIKILI